MFIGATCLDPVPVELRLAAAAEDLECTGLAHRVRPDEDPVLPRRQATEDARLERLAAAEPQVRLEPGQRIGRQAAAFLERKTDLVRPVERIGCGRDEPEAVRG